jgi:hypothetical protein
MHLSLDFKSAWKGKRESLIDDGLIRREHLAAQMDQLAFILSVNSISRNRYNNVAAFFKAFGRFDGSPLIPN